MNDLLQPYFSEPVFLGIFALIFILGFSLGDMRRRRRTQKPGLPRRPSYRL